MGRSLLPTSQGPVLRCVVEQPDRLDPILADLKELGEAHRSLWKVRVVKDRCLVAGINPSKDVDRRLQPLDKALEASDEASCASALSGDRSLEVEIVVEDPPHARLIEGRDPVPPAA